MSIPLLYGRKSVIQQGLSLLRRLGDQAAAYLPGVANPDGSHWVPGASLVPTAGTLGPDGIRRPSQLWFNTALDSANTVPTSVDSPVGFMSDGEGSIGFPGKNATQATGSAKPTLRRGVVAASQYSDLSTNWTFGSLTKTTGQVGPTGENDATILTATATNAHALYQFNQPVVAGQRYTLAAEVKLGTAASVVVAVLGSGGTQLANTEVAGQITGGTWGIVAVPFTAQTTTTNAQIIFFRDCAAAGQTVFVRRIAILSGEVTAAQIQACGGIPLTTTVAASSAAGNYALEFNGSATQMQAAFAPTAAATAVFGVRVNSFSGAPVLIGQAAGGLQVSVNASGGVQAGINGGTNISSANGVIVAGNFYVISVRIAVNSTSTIRVNGVVVATSTAITTAMNQSLITIGSNGSSNFTNGLFGPGLLSTLSLTDAETVVLEQAYAALTGPTPNGMRF